MSFILSRLARTSLLLLGATLLLLLPQLTFAQSSPEAASSTTTMPTSNEKCQHLLELSFLDIPDAPTRINSVSLVAGSGRLPEYCKVDAFVAPAVGFEIDLPTTTWNDRLLMQGCGGSCGLVSTRGCSDMLEQNFAVTMTDMGHRGKPIVGWSWAEHNLQGVIDFGYRATHVSLLAARAIETAFYGRAPKYSYFRGCSTGGRQAMIEAQRFPDDFDGIVAIAPVLDETADTPLHLVWSARAANDRSGQKLITADDVMQVHAAVLAACGAVGPARNDGIVEDPLGCSFDVAQLACGKAPAQHFCLKPAALDAFEKLYRGATSSLGKPLTVGGMLPGSELGWIPYFIAPGKEVATVLQPAWLVTEFMRYMMFYETAGQDYSVFDFDFERDAPRLGLMEQIYAAKNPDLRGYRDRGGKLILVEGLADPLIPPASVMDYYDSAVRVTGSRQATEAFFRLFMVPGMQHCVGGETADAIDYMAALQQWVERGQAPEQLLAYHSKAAQTMLNTLRFPLARSDWDWARPVFPYPNTAAWNGQGEWQLPEHWSEVERTDATAALAGPYFSPVG